MDIRKLKAFQINKYIIFIYIKLIFKKYPKVIKVILVL